MVSAAFYLTDFEFSSGFDSPKNQMSIWLQNAKAFGVDKLIMIDMTSFKIGKYYQHSDEEILFERYDSLDEAMSINSDSTWVFVEISPVAQSLKTFQHPPNDVIYLVGPDFGAIDTQYQPSHWVVINTNKPKALYAQTAMMVALYDRLSKQ